MRQKRLQDGKTLSKMVYFPIEGKKYMGLLQEKLQNWINNKYHSLRSNISTLGTVQQTEQLASIK